MFSDFRVRIYTIAALFFLLISPVHASEVNAAVASNFAAPMESIVALFQKESGHTVKVSLGSSGKLYAQIKSGAPFDIFLSGDDAIPKRLMQEGLADADSRFVYAEGKLVLWSAQPNLVDEKGKVLSKGNFNRLAIANPRYSPYGVAAKETLEKLTMWNSIQEKLSKGDDLMQTYQFAATENVDLAFIALSQIMRNGKVTKSSWWLVPDDFHKPISQSAVMLSGSKEQEAAKSFLTFLKSEKAAAVMRSFGYETP